MFHEKPTPQRNSQKVHYQNIYVTLVALKKRPNAFVPIHPDILDDLTHRKDKFSTCGVN